MEIVRQTLVPQKIILVDQSDDLTQSLKTFLMSRGFLVISTTDADGLAKVVKDADINLIVVNVGLPNFVGFKALRFLRIQAETRSLPIIAISADGNHLQQSLSLGASDFMVRDQDIISKATRLVEKYLVHLSARWHGEIN